MFLHVWKKVWILLSLVFALIACSSESNLSPIVGEVVPNKLSLLLKPDVSESVLLERLTKLGFTLEKYRSLGATDGPCANGLADISTNGKPLSQAIGELEKENIALYVDPIAVYRVDTRDPKRNDYFIYDYANAINVPIAHRNGFSGVGTTIAVLDTGGSGHNWDDVKVINPFNAITGGSTINDVSDDGKHGFYVASYAVKVAPQTKIMPIKTCASDRTCLSDNVIVGVCYALARAKEQVNLDKLILNMSFSGDTFVGALQAVLDYALKYGTQVVTDAGRVGELGSPKQYPAAFDLPGLVAVGMLQAQLLRCIVFNESSFPLWETPLSVGDKITDGEVEITAKEFFLSNSQVVRNGNATRYSISGSRGARVVYLSLNNITTQFAFPTLLEGINFKTGEVVSPEESITVNLEVNGDLRIVRDLVELDKTIVGGVRVYATKTHGIEYHNELPVKTTNTDVELHGNITQFAIGGQELQEGTRDFGILNVCPSNASSWQPATFNTRGDYLDLSVPAGAYQYYPAYNFRSVDNTPFSTTSLVAGAIALWKQANPTLTPVEIEANLKRTAHSLPFATNEVGAGLLNLNVAPFNVPFGN
jgi:hypothetical protein